MQEIGSIQSDLGKKLMVYACEGVLTFRKICKLHSDRKESELKEFYEVAIKKGMVFMLDLFLLTNVYALGEGILDLVADVEGERLKVE